jgi:hypothetical protein
MIQDGDMMGCVLPVADQEEKMHYQSTKTYGKKRINNPTDERYGPRAKGTALRITVVDKERAC